VTRLSIGVMLSTSGESTATDVRSFARHVEQLGLDAVFAGDHLTPRQPLLDATVTLATAAAATERIRIGYGVMVVALRHPAWVARELSSLQKLSGNRVILGVGSGGAVHGTAAWDAVGVPYAERGQRTDAALAILPQLIAGRPTRLGNASSLTLAPGAEVPPIWIGGGSEAALRRSVEHGAAWFPSMVPPAFVAAGARRMDQLAAVRGSSRPGIAVGGATLLGVQAPGAVLEGFIAGLTQGYGMPRQWAAAIPITGPPAQAAERFAEYAGAGADHLVLGVIGGDWQEQCELIAEARALLG
jgi:alkanesulfonate monooxygenase SsuD/methylene tetrahydromethanopterin reductase-like flavin-dependent oxidoreductase (luciferase family)